MMIADFFRGKYAMLSVIARVGNDFFPGAQGVDLISLLPPIPHHWL